MWTFKRVMILLGGMFLFLIAFAVYAYFLGNIDGLPLLPIGYLAGEEGPPPPPPPPGETEKKIKWAFGAECEELRRPIRLDLRSKGVLMAAGQCDIEPDGRVKLYPFSAALFPKARTPMPFPEINTIQCETAFLTLDRPVASLTELSNRKIVAVELRGNRGITMINNRRTAEKNDDIELLITNAPLFYEEHKNTIWSDGYVQLLDTQTQPHPTKVTAKGMELKLSEDTSPHRPKNKPRAKGDNVSGVETVHLKSNVDMHLYVDAASGFLAGRPGFGKTPAPKKPAAEKSHIVLKTNGPFTYDVTKEKAWFESPPAHGVQAAPEQVLVSREHKLGDGMKYDQLLCDRLDLQFRSKQSDHKAAGEGRGGDNKEIESALATARSGKEVVLTMDTENLEAYGLELHYRCASATTGPQTILKGSPLRAVQAGHKIEARELHLIGADKEGNGQRAFAKGPGQIDLYDKSNAQKPYPSHALWEDSLIMVKEREEREADKILDVLTMTGNASFIDEEHRQELHGQRLQVWLESMSTGDRKKDRATPHGRHAPRKIEAFDKVVLRSPEFIVKRTNHLKIVIRNEPGIDAQLPDALPAVAPAPGAVGQGQPKIPPLPGEVPAAAVPAVGVATPRPTNPASPTGSRKPIELEANEVVAYIGHQGAKKQLQELVTEGAVHVFQDGDGQKNKGIDIVGEMLNLIHHPQGDILYVFGDSKKFAQLQLGEMILIGPKVTINQRDNTAEVEGTGTMSLPSNTTFEGGKPSKKDTRLTVHWNKDMLFNGKDAEFFGGVVAYQENGSMRCQYLQVILDRTVSFKQGQKENHGAKVEKLLCHQKVYLEDKKEADGKLQQLTKLQSHDLHVDNEESFGNAAGPGRFIHFAPGSADGPLGPQPGGPKGEVEMKHTRIEYEQRMYFKNKDNSRNAKFYGNVEVFHAASNDPDFKMNADKPPKNAFYLKANFLDVYTRVIEGKASQMMQAHGNVFFRTQEFYGRANVVKYDEAQDQVIFEGGLNAPATLYKKNDKGETQEIKGSKIVYSRKTGIFQLDGGKVIQSRLEDRTPALQYVHATAALRQWWHREGSCELQ